MNGSSLSTRVFTKEELCLIEEVPQPCGIIIFGASGDLTHRKLLPSLYFLQKMKRMPKQFYILGVARTPLSDDEFRLKAKESLKGEPQQKDVDAFLDHCHYLSGVYNETSLYTDLKNKLSSLDKKYKINPHYLFYLSTPPSLYCDIIQKFGESGLTRESGKGEKWSRVVIEKPFGDSYASARALNKTIRQRLKERQIYRIDHYLGKETVQNIMMFRFANLIFEPVWNRNYIEQVQITASEKLGVEHRAGYYEQAGVLRDMFQNHLFQLVALTATESPLSLKSDAVRDKKVDVFRSIRVMKPNDVFENTVCAQYGDGTVDGEKVNGYLKEKSVNKESRIPTFAAIRLELDSWRWQGVPFYVRSGKRMKERLVEIVIQFKRVPASIFKPLSPEQLSPNVLKFRIQPDEGIRIQFEAKHPGPKLCLGTVTMDFEYEEAFKTPPPESYVRLFHDAMLGDQTLFSRSDGVEQCWKIIDPIISAWENKKGPALAGYKAGSWGPVEAEKLLQKWGHTWF